MTRRGRHANLVVLVVGIMLGAAACAPGAAAVSTALAITPTPPPGTPFSGGQMPVTPGAAMAGVIGGQGEEHVYTFAGTAGMAVTVDMQAAPDGMLDSYLELRAPDGSVLATDDDGGSGLDSRLANVVLPEDGEYTLLAYGYNHISTGAYGLNLILGTPIPSPTPSPTLAPGGGPIEIGGRYFGSINGVGQVDRWTFAGAAGDIITAEMAAVSGTGSGIDSFLELIGPNQSPMIANDNGGAGQGALLPNIVLPEDGEYTLVCSGQNASLGQYTLSLQRGIPPSPTPPPSTPGPTPTMTTQTIILEETAYSAVLPNSGGTTHLLRIEAPLTVEVTLHADNPDARLMIDMFDPLGTHQTLMDYGSLSSVIYLPGVALRMAGEYGFRVMSTSSTPVTYSLLIAPLESEVSGSLVYGQGVSGELLFPGQEDYWTFEGTAGDTVVIVMSAANMDTYLVLQDDAGVALTRNDDYRSATNSRIEYILPRDGLYTIVASSYQNRSTGAYRLLLFRGE